jgi:hypothetical protein
MLPYGIEPESKPRATGQGAGGGPKTPEGKARSSRNALKHGLTAAKHSVLDIEMPAEFEAVRNDALQEFRPHSLTMVRIIEALTHLDWTIARLHSIETAYLNFGVNEARGIETPNPIEEAAQGGDSIAALVQGWINASGKSSPFDLLRRYSATLQSKYNSTLNNYLKLENRHHKRGLNPEFQEPYIIPLAEPPPPSPMENHCEHSELGGIARNTGIELDTPPVISMPPPRNELPSAPPTTPRPQLVLLLKDPKTQTARRVT